MLGNQKERLKAYCGVLYSKKFYDKFKQIEVECCCKNSNETIIKNLVVNMAFDIAKKYLDKKGYGDRVKEFDVSSATVELAATAVGTEPARIAKSLTFMVDEKPLMILCAGDAKIANSKFKAFFHTKAKMLSREQVSDLIGHEVGGVCPFGIKDGVTVYLDDSLKRFDIVYPACGSDNSAVELTIVELEECSNYLQWIDVCQY